MILYLELSEIGEIGMTGITCFTSLKFSMFKNSSFGLGKQVLKVRLYQIGSVIDETGVNSATERRGDISLQKSVQFFEFFS